MPLTLLSVLAVVLPPLVGLLAAALIFRSTERYRRELRNKQGRYAVERGHSVPI
jgi:hypothetical protein